MKDNKTRRAYIQARAEGKSYDLIAKELKISKGTCTAWDKEYKAEIKELQAKEKQELTEAFTMQREARIKSLQDTLDKVNAEIEKRSFDDLSLRDLLNIKLQYSRSLKEELPEPIEVIEDNTIQGVIAQYNILFNEASRLSPAEVKARLEVLRQKHALFSDYASIIASDSNPLNISFDGAISYADVMLRGETPEEV